MYIQIVFFLKIEFNHEKNGEHKPNSIQIAKNKTYIIILKTKYFHVWIETKMHLHAPFYHTNKQSSLIFNTNTTWLT